MRKAKWRIVTAVLLCFAFVWSCVDGFVPSGTAFAAGDAEATPTKYDAAGWQITLKDAAKGTSMKEIGASLDFSEAASAAQDKSPTAGSVYYVLEMSFENVSSEETIDWESDVYLKDSAAKQYSRIDDDFLDDYGMEPLTDDPLESGNQEGWICFEVPETVDKLTLVVAFDAESLEIPVEIEEDEPETESEMETVTEAPVESETETETETETEVSTETESETELSTETETETEVSTETESESETSTETETETEASIETESQTETDAQTETELQPETESETEKQTEIESETEIETETEIEKQTESETETELQTESGTEPQTETESETESGTEIESETETEELWTEIKYADILKAQSAVDEALVAEAQKGYSFEAPYVIVNPYKNSPLTAVVIFTTEEETGVEVVVCGKDEKNDITASFGADKTHILPIYGLYAGDTTEVVLTLDDGTSTTLEITTESLNEETAAVLETAGASTQSEASSTSGDGTDAVLVIETEAPDATLTGAEVTVYAEAADAVLAANELTFAFVQSTQEGISGAVAYDNAGEIRWFMEDDTIRAYPMKRLANGRMMALTADVIGGEDSSSGLVEFDLCGKFYAIYLVPGGVHHDFVEMENGNLLVCSNSEDFSTLADRVLEIDRETGEVVYELILAEPLETEEGAAVRVIDEDWYHINSIDYDEASDTLLISCPNHDAVLAVDKTEKELLWMLIDPTGLFTTVEGLFFTVAEGEEDFEWPHAQTNVSFLPDGDILVFDNGVQQTETESGAESAATAGSGAYSRAVRYHLDTENMTISQVWSYGTDRGEVWDSSELSGVVYLDEDTYWITSGSCVDGNEGDDSSAEDGAETESAAAAEDSDADSAQEEILCTYIDLVVGEELVYELTIPASTYRSMRAALYTEENTYSVSEKGVWYGNLGAVGQADANGLTATVGGTTSTLAAIAKATDSAKKSVTSRMSDASKEMIFTLSELVNMPDRLQVSGSWYRTGSDASLVLISEYGDVYRFAIEADNPESESEAADFALWITDESVPAGHRYYIYLYNRGVLYKTHRYWTVS